MIELFIVFNFPHQETFSGKIYRLEKLHLCHKFTKDEGAQMRILQIIYSNKKSKQIFIKSE